jgi:hypothetical protein
MPALTLECTRVCVCTVLRCDVWMVQMAVFSTQAIVRGLLQLMVTRTCAENSQVQYMSATPCSFTATFLLRLSDSAVELCENCYSGREFKIFHYEGLLMQCCASTLNDLNQPNLVACSTATIMRLCEAAAWAVCGRVHEIVS